MNIESLRTFCLSLKGVTESFPFDETTLVFKVMEKIFCLTDLKGDLAVNMKNEPEKILTLREEYPAVKPGYHMNKKYWITVLVDESISDAQIKSWILESYERVVQGLPKIKQQELKKRE
jgi:predicted DNA-binding protein (MmcQ/YjbR family)